MNNPMGRCENCLHRSACKGLMQCVGYAPVKLDHKPPGMFPDGPIKLDLESKPTGLKFDQGKQRWFAMPLEILEPLADVFDAGVQKYELFNCLERFDDANKRFYDGMMRHVRASQLDPLAKDVGDTECYHLAQVAFNALIRLYQSRRYGA